jgi:hypothetical protein
VDSLREEQAKTVGGSGGVWKDDADVSQCQGPILWNSISAEKFYEFLSQ